MLKITKIVAAMLAVAFMTAGCNTMSGAGKDVQSVGQSVEKSAEESKK